MTTAIRSLSTSDISFSVLPEKIVALPIREGYELILEDSIMFCKAEGNYTLVQFTDGNKLLISKNLKGTASCFSNPWFMRIHQSYLVNLKYACQYVRGSGGQLKMKDGSVFPVSKNQKNDLLRLFDYVK